MDDLEREEMKNQIDSLAKEMPMEKFLRTVADVGEKQKFIEELKAQYPEATIDELNEILEQLVEREQNKNTQTQEDAR